MISIKKSWVCSTSYSLRSCDSNLNLLLSLGARSLNIVPLPRMTHLERLQCLNGYLSSDTPTFSITVIEISAFMGLIGSRHYLCVYIYLCYLFQLHFLGYFLEFWLFYLCLFFFNLIYFLWIIFYDFDWFVTVAPWKLFTFVSGTAAVWPSSWNAQFIGENEREEEREGERGRERERERLAQTPHSAWDM